MAITTYIRGSLAAGRPSRTVCRFPEGISQKIRFGPLEMKYGLRCWVSNMAGRQPHQTSLVFRFRTCSANNKRDPNKLAQTNSWWNPLNDIDIQHRQSARVVDLFCGLGGLSYGFRRKGFDVAAGIDADASCEYAYRENIGADFICKDIRKVTAEEISAFFDPSRPSVLVGCAPCQPFSTYNQKNSDPNWRLLETFASLIEDTQPDVVSMENVPRLQTFRGGIAFSGFKQRLIDAGYFVDHAVLYGPDYGMAQTRSRLVLLASRHGPIAVPDPTHTGRYRTVRDEIGDLPVISHGEVSDADPLHRASALSDLNQRRIAASKPGGTWRDWDEALRAKCHRVETGRGYSSVYGRMKWSEPSPTVTTQFYGFGNGRFGHPDQNRALSLREGAMLQGFPPDYCIVPPGARVQFTNVGRMIGNAVPVHLAEAIAGAVWEHLSKLNVVTWAVPGSKISRRLPT